MKALSRASGRATLWTEVCPFRKSHFVDTRSQPPHREYPIPLPVNCCCRPCHSHSGLFRPLFCFESLGKVICHSRLDPCAMVNVFLPHTERKGVLAYSRLRGEHARLDGLRLSWRPVLCATRSATSDPRGPGSSPCYWDFSCTDNALHKY